MIKIPLHRELLNPQPDEKTQNKCNPFNHLFNIYFRSARVLFNAVLHYFGRAIPLLSLKATITNFSVPPAKRRGDFLVRSQKILPGDNFHPAPLHQPAIL